MKYSCKFLMVLVFFCVARPAMGTPPLADIIPLPEAVSENLRLAVDLSTRPAWSENRDEFFFQNVIGLDLHKVISSESRDWATLIIQTYFTRIDRFEPAPPPFDDGDDWEVIYRILNINFAARTDGHLSIRVGHFELPFGLEHVVNTNGTLRDYLHPRNFGLKADWGVSVNGDFPAFEYEVGLTRGSGNRWEGSGDPWAVSGRVGTPRNRMVSYGLSGFRGEPMTMLGPQKRWKVGLDAIIGYGPVGVFVESSYGENADAGVSNSLVEANWTNPDEQWLVFAQFMIFAEEKASQWDESVGTTVGVRFTPNAQWSASASVARDLHAFDGALRETVLKLQLRFRL